MLPRTEYTQVGSNSWVSVQSDHERRDALLALGVPLPAAQAFMDLEDENQANIAIIHQYWQVLHHPSGVS